MYGYIDMYTAINMIKSFIRSLKVIVIHVPTSFSRPPYTCIHVIQMLYPITCVLNKKRSISIQSISMIIVVQDLKFRHEHDEYPSIF